MKPQRLNEPDQRLGAHKDTRAGGKVRQCAVTRERLAPDALRRGRDGVIKHMDRALFIDCEVNIE